MKKWFLRNWVCIVLACVLTVGFCFTTNIYGSKTPEIVVDEYASDQMGGAIEAAVESLVIASNAIEEHEDTEHETVETEIVKEPELKSLGEFYLTAYCGCTKCCGKWAANRPVDENGKPIVKGSTGEVLHQGESIAVDPKVIPYGSKVIINGQEYIAQDCGGGIKQNRIDVYFESHEEARKFAVQNAEVFLVVTSEEGGRANE